ncbi:CHAP domain-containing protein [Purpureocillium lilacinum]|uniref:CHAP domain-containing protein n=1 Tax=Purpureocillium lilacinum TaxID=33203 RepID=A0A179FQZ1_PURLI|nr:CHAP domain-containing protein [Purpureocillium lilacinum]KAK4083321.1 hypothetical protein Purlil1_10732 [Purpureocillium lilacinum]OAQ67449.1 CHAP domain-containing protein [Purpureocillium lilacinum]OAQ89735.1 CHAP domain-containing protein [Purpureocillium lilacinum]PWI68220.1 hypothetical protein PCL_01989 [Purpureocillium lilacinum]GJN69427.1 hypothetical protein PLICBS_003475 [Purpureocillium lilacinum]
MKVFALAASAIGLASVASAFPITGSTVNCRAGPDTSSAVKKTYTKGTDVKIVCQTEGPTIEGNSIWDKTSDGCYVADFYVKTGKNGYVTDKCPGTKPPGGGDGGGGSIPGPVKNDYPYNGRCSGIDPWKYYKCQCTSFVAWRINKRLGIKFHNYFKGPNWGDAKTWDEAARKTGYKVDNNPKPGSIAQHSRNKWGHVAWVTKVNGNQVTIEEYNHVRPDTYSVRTVNKSEFVYIHLKAGH